MSAPMKNQYWRLVSQPGRPPKFKTPQELWSRCIDYFDWVEANPLLEEKLFSHQGKVIKGTAQKMRAMTLGGLCLFLGIDRTTWWSYREREDFSTICTLVEEIIREQKFTGAAADLLNPSIIARDLGLRETSELQHTGKDGGPIQTQVIKEIIDEELVAIISASITLDSDHHPGTSSCRALASPSRKKQSP